MMWHGRRPVLDLELSLMATLTASSLFLLVSCTAQTPDTSETHVTTTDTPATQRETLATQADTPATQTGTSAAQTGPAATAEFNKAVAAYVDLHEKADGQVPSLKRTDDAKEISSREVALGDTIRALRASARPGDVITAEIAREFRRLIKSDYQGRDPDERKFFLEEIPTFRPVINQAYPSTSPLATFPATLLVVMPKLPEILEYRLLREGLILRDVKANIIVDYIPDVY